MKITHCKLKKKVQKELLRFLYWKLPPVLHLQTVLSDYARFDDALLSYFDFN
ncbi:hypothetical protein NMXN1568_0266 [Neisseria meningitidis N1568]|nr:hypothetical protein NMXN1568_0266 [Neisseria meningitidis N1568]